MRKPLIFVSIVLLTISACAATLTMQGTAPTQLNDAISCSATPVLSDAPAGSAVTVHFRWVGPSSGEDSLATTIGTPVTMTRSVKPGSYLVYAWASNILGGAYNAGCDTSVVKVVGGKPGKVGLLP